MKKRDDNFYIFVHIKEVADEWSADEIVCLRLVLELRNGLLLPSKNAS